eukprot:scaffold61255_cov54-Phaeocystis_antarctica.AAC.2
MPPRTVELSVLAAHRDSHCRVVVRGSESYMCCAAWPTATGGTRQCPPIDGGGLQPARAPES